MKVAIFTEGGRNIGFGHIARCLALSQGIRDLMPDAVIKFIINGDSLTERFLKDYDFEVLNFNWQTHNEKTLNLARTSSVSIIDSYLTGKYLYDEISKINNTLLFMIDDYNRIEYPAGVVINPSIYGDMLAYPQKKDVVYLIGSEYILLRKEFWSAPEKDINKQVKNAIVLFGGISNTDLTQRVTRLLEDRFDLDVFANRPEDKIYDSKGMLEIMLDADICVCGGGQVTYELARIGVPTVGICLFKNQELNLEWCYKKDIIKYAGYHSDKNLLERIESGVKDYLPYEKRIYHSRIGRECVDGKGPRRIAEYICNTEN